MKKESSLDYAIDSNFKRIISKSDIAEINKSRIFITGGTGFIGFWLLSAIKHLNENGLNIYACVLSREPLRFLERYPHFKKSDWLNFVVGDIENYTFPEGHFDYLIHAATDTSFEASSKPVNLLKNIINGSLRVFEHSRVSQIRRVLLISSGAVYGVIPQNIQKVDENMNFPIESFSRDYVYCEAKRLTELIGQLYFKQYGIESVIARCFTFSGFGLASHLALNQFLFQALHNDKIVINGSGKSLRSYLYAADMSVWLLTILLKGAVNEAYNVGSDESHSILDLAGLIRDRFAPGKEIVVTGAEAKTGRNNYIPSIEKAKSLGLDVWFQLEESIMEYKKQAILI